MRLQWLIIFALVLLCGAAPPEPVPAGRNALALDAGWRFHRGDVAQAAEAPFDDAGWDPVTLPHSFNASDGETPDYYRGPGWYRRTFQIATVTPGRRLFIEFDGAATCADIFLNGIRIGRHEGGHARFRFDLTRALRPGANLLAVRIDNSPNDAVTPLGGDFTVFGGLYRAVRLIETDDVHVDMGDFGGPGVYAGLDRFEAGAARVTVRARIANEGMSSRTVPVQVQVLDASGNPVSTQQGRVEVGSGAVTASSFALRIARPRRWDGVRDPYLYTVRVQLAGAGDAVSIPLGLREVRFDPALGLLLNGHPYDVHGVNLMASARPGKGTAVTGEEVDEDFAILRDMGSTGVRLVHFQHGPEAYAATDRLGLVTWTEIGINSRVADTPAFRANAEQQLRELIAQNYNHPSVALWGIGNEVYAEDQGVVRVLDQLNAVARSADPSRPTIYAHCCQADDHAKARITSLIAFNRYFGWYPDQGGTLGVWAAGYHAAHPDKPFAISEYGAGGSILHQEEVPRAPVPASGWHPEAFQAEYHERNWQEIAGLRYVFAKFIWVGFDLASAGRREGDRRGINDKGLVTYDRQVRKDAWYWYQANWSDRPMLHIVGRRYKDRTSAVSEIKVYSNVPRVDLWLNGASLGSKAVAGHIARWRVQLRPGENRLEARDGSASGRLADVVSVRFAPPPGMIQAVDVPGRPPR